MNEKDIHQIKANTTRRTKDFWEIYLIFKNTLTVTTFN